MINTRNLSEEDFEEIEKLKRVIRKNIANLECPMIILPEMKGKVRIGRQDLKIVQQDGDKYAKSFFVYLKT